MGSGQIILPTDEGPQGSEHGCNLPKFPEREMVRLDLNPLQPPQHAASKIMLKYVSMIQGASANYSFCGSAE